MNPSDFIGPVLSAAPNPRSGMNNRTILLTTEGGQYLHRIPGAGTDLFCCREWEIAAYRALAGSGITDVPIAIEANGEKLTGWYPDSRICDPRSEGDVSAAMALLRRLHAMPVQLMRRENLYMRMLRFGAIAGDAFQRRQDYRACIGRMERKSHIFACGEEALRPIHGDALPGNFLFRSHAAPLLIDLEFAAMGSIYEDLAGFCHDAQYSPAQSEALLETYLERKASAGERQLLHLYTAAAALMWAGWAAYKQRTVPEKADFFRDYADMSIRCALEREEFEP